MSKNIGFLVVSGRTGFLVEGKPGAAKIFDSRRAAQSICKPQMLQVPEALTYHQLTMSLLKGTAFCFDTAAGHERFIALVRNDPAHKMMLKYCEDGTFIKWRYDAEKISSDTSVVTDAIASAPPARQSPVEAPTFNPAILVR
jgi:hypothetical protein